MRKIENEESKSLALIPFKGTKQWHIDKKADASQKYLQNELVESLVANQIAKPFKKKIKH